MWGEPGWGQMWYLPMRSEQWWAFQFFLRAPWDKEIIVKGRNTGSETIKLAGESSLLIWVDWGTSGMWEKRHRISVPDCNQKENRTDYETVRSQIMTSMEGFLRTPKWKWLIPREESGLRLISGRFLLLVLFSFYCALKIVIPARAEVWYLNQASFMGPRSLSYADLFEQWCHSHT